MLQLTTGRIARTFTALAVAITAACSGDGSTAPDLDLIDFPYEAAFRAPDLGPCSNLAVEGSRVVYRVFATGDQIYRWNGSAWTLVAPDAKLYSDAKLTTQVGTHYAGPSWESNSGNVIVGQVLQRCTVSATDVQWLLLGVKSNTGVGIFQNATHIQRVNTAGGVAPATPGSAIGEEVRVPYSTEYYFLRVQ